MRDISRLGQQAYNIHRFHVRKGHFFVFPVNQRSYSGPYTSWILSCGISMDTEVGRSLCKLLGVLNKFRNLIEQ